MLNRSRSLSKWKIRIRMWVKRVGMDITHQIKTRSHSRIGIGCAILTALAMGIYLLIRSLPQLIAWMIEIVPTIEPNLVNGVILFILSFILVCPFTVGYGLVLLIGSYVFGWVGLPILYFGSLFGSWTWFILIRHFAQRWNVSARIMRYVYIYFPSLLRHHQTIEAVSLTFDSHGMKVCCLLQMGVLPFGVLNGLLALQPFVRFSPDFIVSTMVSRLKIINYIIIATSLKDVNQLLGSGERKFGLQDGIMIGRAILFSLLSLFIITRYARKELARIQASQDLSSIQQQQLSLNEQEGPVHHTASSSPLTARRSQTDSNITTSASSVPFIASSTSSISEAPSLPFTQSTSDYLSNRPLVHPPTSLSSSFSSPPTAAIARNVYFPLMHHSIDGIICPTSNQTFLAR